MQASQLFSQARKDGDAASIAFEECAGYRSTTFHFQLSLHVSSLLLSTKLSVVKIGTAFWACKDIILSKTIIALNGTLSAFIQFTDSTFSILNGIHFLHASRQVRTATDADSFFLKDEGNMSVVFEIGR